MNPPQKRTAAQQKADALLLATDVLSSRVGALADAVQINNHKIDVLQSEVNKKPDDVELKFVEQQARLGRTRAFRNAVTTAVLAAVVSATVAYWAADRAGQERCKTNAQNIATLVSIIDTPELRELYADQIADLRSNRNECE